MPKKWSEKEVKAVVEDYFDMLCLELRGQRFNKSEHRRALLARLDNRSLTAIELKHQNISAVLIEMGIPSIDGYKPLSNYQRLMLPSVVCDYLKSNPQVQALFETHCDAIPTSPRVEDWQAELEEPPPKGMPTGPATDETPIIGNPAGVNYLEREARNQQLGNAGEEFIIELEHARLLRAGREHLADRIERISETQGPTAGFDILSYEKSGQDRFIEVKTTKYGPHTPFFVTRNELKFSRENSSQYYLYRLFRFGVKPRLYTLHGHLQDQCRMEPSLYLART